MREPVAQKVGRFGDAGQLQLVTWMGEVQHAKTADVLLVLGVAGRWQLVMPGWQMVRVKRVVADGLSACLAAMSDLI